MDQTDGPCFNSWTLLRPKFQKWLDLSDRRFISHQIEIEMKKNEITCALCPQGYLLTSAQFSQRSSVPRKHEDGVILPCSHVFGLDCMGKWKGWLRQKGTPFHCPCCLTDINPPRCDKHRGLPEGVNLKGYRGMTFAVLSARVEEFLQKATRNKEEALSCPECLALETPRRSGSYGIPFVRSLFLEGKHEALPLELQQWNSEEARPASTE